MFTENIDFSVNGVLDNNRLPYESRSRIRAKIHETSEYIFRHNLENFFNGVLPFEKKSIIERIPEKSILYGQECHRNDVYQVLSQVSTITDSKIIKEKIREKIEYLISDECFDQKTGSFKFIDPKMEEEILSKKNISHENVTNIFGDNKYISKNWINSLSVIALVKWLIYSEENDQRITDTVKKGLGWINQNSDIYFENYYGWNEYYKGVVSVYKTCETCLSLQTLLRTFKIPSPIDVEFSLQKFIPFLETILRLQCAEGEYSGGWPSEIIYSGQDEEYIYSGLIGSTSAACQFLCDCLILIPDEQIHYHKDHIFKALSEGSKVLIKHQVKDRGCWYKEVNESLEPSIDFTTSATQALLKLNQIGGFSISDSVEESISKSLEWITSSFCLIKDDGNIDYAWTKEGIHNVGCEKNTSFAVGTLLKAGVPADTYIVRKSILWLLNAEPEFKFDNVYIYCAILEYLKSLEKKS